MVCCSVPCVCHTFIVCILSSHMSCFFIDTFYPSCAPESHDSVNVNTNSHAPEFGVDEEELIRLFKEEDLKNSVSNFG